MWAIGLWAISHLIANGDLRSLLFFGAFAVLSLGGTVLIDRKKQLALGSNWPRLPKLHRTCRLPLCSPGAPGCAGATSVLRVAAGLLLYAVLYLAHPIIAGLPVMVPQ